MRDDSDGLVSGARRKDLMPVPWAANFDGLSWLHAERLGVD
jgi:hypothetical protein